MTSEHELLTAIHAQPADDAVRLVYADWLEEHGTTDAQRARADFIRAQIQAAHLPEGDAGAEELRDHAEALREEHDRVWSADLRKLTRDYQYARGFVEEAALRASRFVPDPARLLALAPVRRLTLEDTAGKLSRLTKNAEVLARLTALRLEGDPTVEDLRALADWPLTGLTSLDLRNNERVGPGAMRALARAPWLAGVRSLNLRRCHLGLSGVRALAASPHLKALAVLDLQGNSLGDEGLRVLAESDLLDGLATLDLCTNDLHPEGLRSLADSARAAGLREIDLDVNWLGAEGMEVLAGSATFGNLTRLAFGFDIENLGNAGARTLAASPHLRRLRYLDLSDNNIRYQGARALADSPVCANLEVLDLYHNPIGRAGAQALAGSPHLKRLRKLNLNGAEIGPEGARALARSVNLAQVTTLDLEGNALGVAGARALVDSPHLTKLKELEVSSDGKVNAILEERFGDILR